MLFSGFLGVCDAWGNLMRFGFAEMLEFRVFVRLCGILRVMISGCLEAGGARSIQNDVSRTSMS